MESLDYMGVPNGGLTSQDHTGNARMNTLAGSAAQNYQELDERVRAQAAHRRKVQEEQVLLRKRTSRLQQDADEAMERYRDSARAVDMAIEREHGGASISSYTS